MASAMRVLGRVGDRSESALWLSPGTGERDGGYPVDKWRQPARQWVFPGLPIDEAAIGGT